MARLARTDPGGEVAPARPRHRFEASWFLLVWILVVAVFATPALLGEQGRGTVLASHAVALVGVPLAATACRAGATATSRWWRAGRLLIRRA